MGYVEIAGPAGLDELFRWDGLNDDLGDVRYLFDFAGQEDGAIFPMGDRGLALQANLGVHQKADGLLVRDVLEGVVLGDFPLVPVDLGEAHRSEEHTYELQSLMR